MLKVYTFLLSFKNVSIHLDKPLDKALFSTNSKQIFTKMALDECLAPVRTHTDLL